MRFSIVIPTYQRRDTVVRTVSALTRQRHDDFEVIAVVDGSTDGTAKALRALSVRFPFTVLNQPNRGAAAARNAGAAAARGLALLFLDDDMEADPALLVEHDRAQRDGADLVLGDIPLHPDSPRNVLTAGVASWSRARRDRLAASDAEIPLADLLTGQMSISRDTFERLGGFDAEITRDGSFGGEDIDFGYRVVSAGFRVAFNPAAISHQYFEVDPADYLRREHDAGRAAHELALKHPERAEQLTAGPRLHGRRRWLLCPLVVAPRAIGRPLREAVAWLVRSGRGGDRLRAAFQAVREVEHLRGVRAAHRAVSTGRVVVLAYHAIADLADDPVLREYGIPQARLAEHLDALARRGWAFVDLDAVLDVLDGTRHLPPRSVLLTFDDAYENLLSAGLPVLTERAVPAVAFAVADRVGGVNEWDREKGARELRLLDGHGLRSLARGGVEIGSHGATHAPLTRVPHDRLAAEIEGSAATLKAFGLARPRALSYPHGEHDAAVAAAARRAGYAVAFTVRAGVVRRGDDRYALRRIEVVASDTPTRLRVKLALARWPNRWQKRALALAKIRT